MFSLRTDCQYPIYSTVQQGGGCLFALAWQTTLPLPHCEQEAVFPWGASQRISDPSSAAAETLPFVCWWCQTLAVARCSTLQCHPSCSPVPVTAFARCPLLCLLYYPGCTVIYLSLAFPTHLPVVICSFQSLFLCSEGVRLKCWTVCSSKVFSAGILTASALSAFQKCFFNNIHKY